MGMDTCRKFTQDGSLSGTSAWGLSDVLGSKRQDLPIGAWNGVVSSHLEMCCPPRNDVGQQIGLRVRASAKKKKIAFRGNDVFSRSR